MTESEIIEKLLTVFYENHGNIRGYVFACTRSYHGTEEVMQSIAIKIAQSAVTFDLERPPMPWFLGIAHHQVKQWYQKNEKEARFVSFDVLDEYIPQFGVFEADQISPRRRALHNCMEKLPGKQKTIVELRYIDNLNCNQIAGNLGKSVQSIYALLKRLKLELRKCVEVQLERPEAVQ